MENVRSVKAKKVMTSKQIQKKYPVTYSMYKNSKELTKIRSYVDFLDKIGFRILLSYASSGGFKVEVRRIKSAEEKKAENIKPGSFYYMVRVGHIPTYQHRKDAMKVGVKLAFEEAEKILSKEV